MNTFTNMPKRSQVAAPQQPRTTQAEEGGDFQGVHIVADHRSLSPLHEVQKRDLWEYAIREFTEAEKLIITLYYYEEMTMREIGATLGISESRVCQMHSSIISRLKGQLDKSCLQECLEAG